MYIKSFLKYSRRNANPVQVGLVTIGGNETIVAQTMANTPTSDVTATAIQAIKTYSVGSKIFRITVPALKDVEHIKGIRDYLEREGYEIPLVADIHFNQKIAFEAAKIVDKVRINPGNFADHKKFESHSYTLEEYNVELERVRDLFFPLLEICNKYNTAIRIGTNHGSLSDRIMSRYGDTPEGMAESAMEFLRMCKDFGFQRVVISMKASNTRIMVQATRFLVSKMNDEDMLFPIHLGVTEAGEGEDGRIKSAVGIGSLLADGIGDTIRVSLTEPPENEIPVCESLIDHFSTLKGHGEIESFGKYPIDPYQYTRRTTKEVLNIGGNNVPVVVAPKGSSDRYSVYPDYTYDSQDPDKLSVFNPTPIDGLYPYFKFQDGVVLEDAIPGFIHLYCNELSAKIVEKLDLAQNKVIVLESTNKNRFADYRAAIFRLINAGIQLPVILKSSYCLNNLRDLQVKAAAELGGIFIDGLADGIWLDNSGDIPDQDVEAVSFGILQATRMRMIKPDYISCPSCGRTMFNLQETTRKIREKTLHLKGLKIGIMGCIVNGLGEMADADYGYIGAGLGKVNLYFNKELIKRGIPESKAVDQLIDLIKEKGDWKEPGE